MPATGIGRAKAAEIHFGIGNGGITIFREVVAGITTGILLVIEKLGSDIIRVESPQHSRHGTMVGIAAKDRIRPYDAIRIAVG